MSLNVLGKTTKIIIIISLNANEEIKALKNKILHGTVKIG